MSAQLPQHLVPLPPPLFVATPNLPLPRQRLRDPLLGGLEVFGVGFDSDESSPFPHRRTRATPSSARAARISLSGGQRSDPHAREPSSTDRSAGEDRPRFEPQP